MSSEAQNLLNQISSKNNNNKTLHKALRTAKGEISRLSKEIKRYQTPPLSYGVVVSVTKEAATICCEAKIFEALVPKNLKLLPGETVRLTPENNQIVAKSAWQLPGEICIIRRIVDDTFVEIDYQGSSHLVYKGCQENIKRGDRIVIDASISVITQNLGQSNDDYTLTEETSVTWDDVGGLENAKAELIEAIETPHQYKNIYSFYNKAPVKGILLWGPPGCGKTLLAQAAATAQAKIHGQKTNNGFFSVKGPEVLSRFVGDAEAAIRNLFLQGKKHKEESNYPALIFIDEAEALLSKRGSGISSDVEKTIVPAFLTEMDGFTQSGSLVILATNRPDALDPAVIRSGRIDRKIQTTRPDKSNAQEIIYLNLKKFPLKKSKDGGLPPKKLAGEIVSRLYADKYPLYKITIEGKLPRSLTLNLCHIVSGAMLASIVKRAASIAMRNDIANNTKTGICLRSVEAALEEEYRENLPLEHQLALEGFIKDFKEDISSIKKIAVRN